MDYCFFCERIVIPEEVNTYNEIIEFFKKNSIPFTFNHTKFSFKLGKKIICTQCKNEMQKIFEYEECDCEECKNQD